jgi:hypothetical protein
MKSRVLTGALAVVAGAVLALGLVHWAGAQTTGPTPGEWGCVSGPPSGTVFMKAGFTNPSNPPTCQTGTTPEFFSSFTPAATPQQCPSGQAVTGIQTNGTVICASAPATVQLIGAGSASTAPAFSNTYYNPFDLATKFADPATAATVLPRSGTLTNLRVLVPAPMVAAFTVFINGAPSPLACITFGPTCTSSASVPVAAGDKMAIQINVPGPPSGSGLVYSVEYH